MDRRASHDGVASIQQFPCPSLSPQFQLGQTGPSRKELLQFSITLHFFSKSSLSDLTRILGRPREPKCTLERIEYGDLGEITAKTVDLLNADQAYLSISANQPISLATVRTKIGEATSMATRLLSNYDSVDAAIAEGQTELVLLAISVKTQLDASEARRTSKQDCVYL